MATKLVKITPQQFENWLIEVCPLFERSRGPVGVYRCAVSKEVAVRIHVPFDSSVKSMSPCVVTMVSRHDRQQGRTLPPPPGSQVPRMVLFNRTCEDWRRLWGKALLDYIAHFEKHYKHYNAEARRTQDHYAKEWKPRIESIKSWKTSTVLKSAHNRLRAGFWLSGHQEKQIWERLKKPALKSKATRSKKLPPSRVLSARSQKSLLLALDRLEAEATTAADTWTMTFASGHVRQRIQRGKMPTPRQSELLRKKLTLYKIYVPAAIAA